jgi:hypothetical protein
LLRAGRNPLPRLLSIAQGRTKSITKVTYCSDAKFTANRKSTRKISIINAIMNISTIIAISKIRKIPAKINS